MRTLDLTAEPEQITLALAPLLAGAEVVALVSPWDDETGYVYHDSEEYEARTDDVQVAASRLENESDASLASRLAARFLAAVDAL
jgi:hypothetical protein